MADQQSQDGSLIVLCPGQGAQHVGMGKAWAQASEAARQVFADADRILDVELSKACFEGPDETINRTDFAQAGLYTCAVASAIGAREQGRLDLSNMVAAAGLSLGEYTALHLAGVFSFEDGLKLVWQRGRFMQDAAEASDGSMVALIGADEEQAESLCDDAREDDVLFPANFNCPGQVVISGSEDACDRALKLAGDKGLRATALTVAGAFHSPLMQPAADQMYEALQRVSFDRPAVPVLSNVTGERHSDQEADIKKRLVEQITSPVRFEQNLRWLLGHVEGSYIELAPGKVLSGLMRRTDRKTKVTNMAEPGEGEAGES